MSNTLVRRKGIIERDKKMLNWVTSRHSLSIFSGNGSMYVNLDFP